MIGLAMLLQVAGGGGTAGAAGARVGDTVWITRTVSVAPRQTVRPGDWTPADPVELVGQPKVTVRGSTVELQYPLTVWRAGTHQIVIPGPLVLGPGGTADSLPPYVTTLTIASVLPVAPPDSAIAPQPRASVVPRRGVSLVPLLVLWALSLVLLVPFRWWWRRRGKPLPITVREPLELVVPVDRWADMGERRVVASLGAARLRAAVESRRSALDAALETESRELLDALDRARFGSDADGDVLPLLRRAEQLEDRIARQPVASAS